MFWRSVNLTGNQTGLREGLRMTGFWRSVNLTGNQTNDCEIPTALAFWRSVNLTGNQTRRDSNERRCGFGAVSI